MTREAGSETGGAVDASGRLADERVELSVSESAVVFEGAVWNVRRDRVDYGDAQIVREYVDHTGAVAVLALDENDRVLVIKQYRHPIATRDWELPAGLLDVEGEDPLEAAKRELAEEVDLEAADWRPLIEFFPSPGGSNELLRVYVARGLTPVAAAFERSDEEADIEQRWVALSALVSAAISGDIRNGILVTSALAAAATL